MIPFGFCLVQLAPKNNKGKYINKKHTKTRVSGGEGGNRQEIKKEKGLFNSDKHKEYWKQEKRTLYKILLEKQRL